MTASIEFIQGAELAQAREPEGSTNNEIGLRILLVGQGGFRPFCRVKPSSEIFPLWGDEVKRESGKLEPPSPRPALALARCVSAGIAAGTEVECVRAMRSLRTAMERAGGELEELHYFLGVDAAPAQSKGADDGAKVVLRRARGRVWVVRRRA
jgi:hypothetical protein